MKALLIVFVLVCSLSLKIPQTGDPPLRLRRSIHAINATERKALFWSTKMLSILPPPKAFANWTFRSILALEQDILQTQKWFTVKPTCIYDILISAHSTACEHGSFYFAHYHRHLMILSQIWLNFAHDIMKKGKSRLLEIYPASLYNEHSQLWEQVFKTYSRQHMGELQFLTAHYWNPSNFQNLEDIFIPIEFDSPFHRKDKKIQAIDHLFVAVRGHHIWEISLKSRMVADSYEWDVKQIIRRLRKTQFFRYSDEEKIQFNSKEKEMLDGVLTPRTQPKGQNFDDFLETINQYLGQRNRNRLLNKIQSRFEDYFNSIGEKDRIPISTATKEEIFVNYGVKANATVRGRKKFTQNQYISKAERRKMNLQADNVIRYNKKLPHYTLAYAMFNKQYSNTFLKYLDVKTGIVVSHNQMHNYYGQFLTDLAYSIICPYFTFFHSWIDFQLQIKIRNFNALDQQQNQIFSNYQNVKDFVEKSNINATDYLVQVFENILDKKQRQVYRNIFNKEINKYLQKIQTTKATNFSKAVEKGMIGNYVIFDWINPLLTKKIKANVSLDEDEKPVIIGLPVREFLLTDTRIRQSDELQDLYHNIYVLNEGHNYEGIYDLTTFPYNHNYQVYNGPNKPLQSLNQAASNIPIYLELLKQEVQEPYDPVDASIFKAIDEVYDKNFSDFYLQNPQWKQMYRVDSKGNAAILKKNLGYYYTSFIRNSTYGLISYSSRNKGTFPIKLKLDMDSKCIKDVKTLLKDGNIKEEAIQRLEQGIKVHNMILNKEILRQDKFKNSQIVLDVGVNLLEDDPEVWKAVRLLQLGKSNILFVKEGAHLLQTTQLSTCACNSLILSAHEGSKQLQIRRFSGAEEVNIDVQIEGVPEQLQLMLPYKIGIKANSFSFEDGSTQSVYKRFDFLKGASFNFNSMKGRNLRKILNHDGHRLYQTLYVTLNDKSPKIVDFFEFTIPTYIVAFTYSENQGIEYSYIRLQDSDYIMKKKMIDHFIYPRQ